MNFICDNIKYNEKLGGIGTLFKESTFGLVVVYDPDGELIEVNLILEQEGLLVDD